MCLNKIQDSPIMFLCGSYTCLKPGKAPDLNGVLQKQVVRCQLCSYSPALLHANQCYSASFFRVSQVLPDPLDLQGHQDYRYVTSNYLLIPWELHTPPQLSQILSSEDADWGEAFPAEPIKITGMSYRSAWR